MKESETIELKKSTSELKEAVISMAAMLNKQGHGTVYFGISDHGFVYGQMTGHETLQVLAQAFVDNIKQATNILFYAIRLSRKRCFVQEI